MVHVWQVVAKIKSSKCECFAFMVLCRFDSRLCTESTPRDLCDEWMGLCTNVFLSADHLQTTCRPPTNHQPTTNRPPTDHLPTTYQRLTDHLPTTYRLPTDHLPTTYQPLFLRCSLFMITVQDILKPASVRTAISCHVPRDHQSRWQLLAPDEVVAFTG